MLGLGAGEPQLYPRSLCPVHSGICEGVAFGVVEIIDRRGTTAVRSVLEIVLSHV